MNIKLPFAFIIFILSFALFAQPLQPIQNNLYPKSIKKVLLVVAMNTEAEPIIKAFNLKKSTVQFDGLPMQSYSGKYAKLDIFMMVNGMDPMYKVENVGTQPATLSTYLGIKRFHPDLVVSIGTAGGVAKNGAQIKHIYLSKKIYFYDRRIPVGRDYTQYGLGGYPSVNLESIMKKTKLESGVVCSGDSFDANQTDAQIIEHQGCTTVDMEAAGVAWVSMLMKTPMVAIKGVTDYTQDKNGHEQFEKNFSYVTKALTENLKQVLGSME